MDLARTVRALGLVLTAALAAEPGRAGIHPAQPTVYDEVRAVLTYPCPYPSAQHAPRVTQENENLYVDVVTDGAICFSNVPYPRTEVAYSLGTLPAGFYRVWVRHIDVSTLSPGVPPRYWHTVSRPFVVVDRIPERISGTWYDPNQPGYGLHVSLIDAERAYVLWATYDEAGRPLWLSALMRVSGTGLAGELHRFRGLGFNRAAGERGGEPVGRLRLELVACERMRMHWHSEQQAFAPGSADLVNLIRPLGVEGCDVRLAAPSTVALPGPQLPGFR